MAAAEVREYLECLGEAGARPSAGGAATSSFIVPDAEQFIGMGHEL